MPRHWSFEDAKQILDHLCSVLATPIVECVSAYWNKGDKNNHASRKKGVNRVEMNGQNNLGHFAKSSVSDGK